MNREQWDNAKYEDLPTKSLSDTAMGGEPQIIKFDWENKWLNGEEYKYMLTHADLYSKAFNLKTYPHKTHPSTTYTEPTGNS